MWLKLPERSQSLSNLHLTSSNLVNKLLNQLESTPFEQWPLGIRKRVKAVSMNSSGRVNSLIVGREHYFRVGSKFQLSGR